MTTNKVSSESPFYFQLIHVNNIWNIKTVFMQNGHRLQWYGIFPLFLIQYLAQLGLLLLISILTLFSATALPCTLLPSSLLSLLFPTTTVWSCFHLLFCLLILLYIYVCSHHSIPAASLYILISCLFSMYISHYFPMPSHF